jgi:hypothetical protein
MSHLMSQLMPARREADEVGGSVTDLDDPVLQACSDPELSLC